MYVTVTKEGNMRKLWVFANDGPWRITGRGTQFLQLQRGWHAWDNPYVTERTWEILLEHGWAVSVKRATSPTETSPTGSVANGELFALHHCPPE